MGKTSSKRIVFQTQNSGTFAMRRPQRIMMSSIKNVGIKSKVKSPEILNLRGIQSPTNQSDSRYCVNTEVEKILYKHGGSYKPDFGIPSAMDFGGKKPTKNGWAMLLDSISGTSKNQRIKNIITKINKEKALRHVTKNDSNSEQFLKTMLSNSDLSKYKYVENIYNKYLQDLRDISDMKAIESQIEEELLRSKSPTLNNRSTYGNNCSPMTRTMMKNEHSIRVIQESLNNLTSTLRHIRKGRKMK